ncbi:MAG: hypothetical protein RR482_08660, partial [Clostridia bacterium]
MRSWLKRLCARPLWVGIIVLAATYMLLTVLLAAALSPERYNLSVGDIATKTIKATKDVVDELTTQLNREQAAKNVQAIYIEEEGASQKVQDQLSYLFQEFEDVRQFGEDLRFGRMESQATTKEGEAPNEYWKTGLANASYAREDLQRASTMVTQLSLSDWQLTTLMNLSQSTLQSVLSSTLSAVKNAMQNTIREGQVEAAITNIQKQIITNTSSDLCWNIAVPAVRACLRPNMVVNQEATETDREKARQAVEPAYYKSGQNIVIAGERTTLQQITVLTSLGLLEGNEFDITLYAGACLLVALLLLGVTVYMMQFARDVLQDPKMLLLSALIFFVTIAVCLLVQPIHPYLAPVSLCALLMAVLVSPGAAVILNLLVSIVVGVAASGGSNPFSQQMVTLTLMGLLSGAVGIFAVRRKQHRVATLLAGIFMAFTGMATVIGVGMLTNNNMRSVLDNAVWALGGGVLA